MSVQFLVKVDDKIWEISECITSISYTDKLNDGCSKLEFNYINADLAIKNGSVVSFKYDGEGVLYGYVFKNGKSKDKEESFTAYDQLRYCKAKDTIVVKDDTVSSLVLKMCNYFSLKKGVLMDTKYKLPVNVQDGKTWLDIIYNAVSDTLVNTGKKYSLRDEFGEVAIRDLEELKLELILGDSNLVHDFDYEKSIDDDFYNQVKLASDNETTGKRDTFITKDTKAIDNFGLLQYFEVLDKNVNTAQAKSMADTLLKLYNREQESLSLECLGDVRIRAGSSFYGLISDIGLNKRLIVKEVTHEFLPNYTMSVEVSI